MDVAVPIPAKATDTFLDCLFRLMRNALELQTPWVANIRQHGWRGGERHAAKAKDDVPIDACHLSE